MLCVRATRFGEPDVLVTTEAPDPVAGPGQALIEVAVADTLHLDTVIRRGAFPFPIVAPPYVPCGEATGTVVSAEPGVDRGLLVAWPPGPERESRDREPRPSRGAPGATLTRAATPSGRSSRPALWSPCRPGWGCPRPRLSSTTG